MVRIRPLSPSRKLTRELTEQLAAQIKHGRLAPGARLPTEQELTRAAKVSRTVVREAVAALRAEGLVVTRQGVGAFVSEDVQRAPFRIDPDQLRSLDDILGIMELRLGVEVESAGLSAVEEDLGFHLAIAESTGNHQFVRFLQFIGGYLIPRHTVSGLPERMGGRKTYFAMLQEEHGRIFAAIRDRKPAAAREAMRAHLTGSLERYQGLAAEQRKAG
jgi:GntR family transcriptional repressor for pyruvate dehydrogenase complex